MVVDTSKTTTECKELVYQLNKLKITENTQNKSYRPLFVDNDNYNSLYFRQWSVQRPNSSFNTSPRPGNY